MSQTPAELQVKIINLVEKNYSDVEVSIEVERMGGGLKGRAVLNINKIPILESNHSSTQSPDEETIQLLVFLSNLLDKLRKASRAWIRWRVEQQAFVVVRDADFSKLEGALNDHINDGYVLHRSIVVPGEGFLLVFHVRGIEDICLSGQTI